MGIQESYPHPGFTAGIVGAGPEFLWSQKCEQTVVTYQQTVLTFHPEF
jgi:hypothetical protein